MKDITSQEDIDKFLGIKQDDTNIFDGVKNKDKVLYNINTKLQTMKLDNTNPLISLNRSKVKIIFFNFIYSKVFLKIL